MNVLSIDKRKQLAAYTATGQPHAGMVATILRQYRGNIAAIVEYSHQGGELFGQVNNGLGSPKRPL